MPSASAKMAKTAIAAILEQSSHTVTEILPAVFDESCSTHITAFLLGFFVGTEGDASAAFGLGTGQARAFEVVGLVLDVGTKFFVHLAVDLSAMKQRIQQRA